VRLVPLFHGGGQERGLRSGTLPTPLCVGFGAAARSPRPRWRRNRRASPASATGSWPAFAPPAGYHAAGQRGAAGPRHLNIAFPGIDADALLAALPELSLSTGSACSSAAVEPSYVIAALGLDAAAARARCASASAASRRRPRSISRSSGWSRPCARCAGIAHLDEAAADMAPDAPPAAGHPMVP